MGVETGGGRKPRQMTLMTYGSRGDVAPFAALGAALQQRGHSVRLAAPQGFASLAEGYGLEFVPLAGDPEDLSREFADQAGGSWLRMVKGMMAHVLPLARGVFDQLQKAAQGADLIVHSFLMTDAGHTLARRQGIPDVSAQLFPVFLPTRAFPNVAMPDWPLGGGYRWATHALNTAVFRYGARLMYRQIRRSAPELPALADWPFAGGGQGQTPVLLAYSPALLPPPADWPPYAHVTGYWPLPAAVDWQPQPEWVRFLEAGPPPVYFGLGSVRSQHLPRLLEAAVSAARACGLRLVLGTSQAAGWGGEDVCVVEEAPHEWLFPRMGLVVHHGGAGTTGAAAAAGVPQTAVPFSVDQTFWARRTRQLGLGPAAPAARELDAAGLEVIFRQGVEDAEYARRAAELGQRMRAEDGLRAAVSRIEVCLDSKS